MRKWLFVINYWLMVVGFLVVLPKLGLVYASQLCPADFSSLCDSGISGRITSLNWVGNIVQVLFVFAIIIALFFLIWGGIKWIMSNGDKSKVTQARDTIVQAIVGLIIALMAYFILDLIVTIITGNHLGNLKLPTKIF